MAHDDKRTSWEEIESLARDYDRLPSEPSRPQEQRQNHTEKPRHASEIDPTDLSDKRQYRLGIKNVDKRLGPLRAGGFTVVGARPGVGKTSLLEQVGIANAGPYRVTLASLEMLETEIRDSVISRLIGCPLDEAERQTAANTDEYRDACDRLEKLNLYIWKPAPRKPRTVDVIIDVALANKTDLLLIDYTRNIGKWQAGKMAEEIVEALSQSAKTTRMHIMLLAQLKIDAHGTRPSLNMLQDTTRLEQEADKVILLYRPYLDDHKRDVIAEIIVAKNRRGQVFRSHVHWHGTMRAFYAMDEEAEARAECCLPKPKRGAKDSWPTIAPDDLDETHVF